jgi:L-threonylcarbamoyladenylate synthase
MSPEKILKNDGIGVLPTDTLYGVVGSAFSKKAVQRIYALKGRDENKPFIVLLAGYTDLKLFGVKPEMQALFKKQSEATRRPTSIILPVTQKKFEYLHRGTKSIAFRMPKNKLLVALLKKPDHW